MWRFADRRSMMCFWTEYKKPCKQCPLMMEITLPFIVAKTKKKSFLSADRLLVLLINEYDHTFLYPLESQFSDWCKCRRIQDGQNPFQRRKKKISKTLLKWSKLSHEIPLYKRKFGSSQKKKKKKEIKQR